MNETTKTKRAYRKIAPEHLEYAKGRFVLLASTSAVRAEIKNIWGVECPHNALYYYWKLANKGFGGALAAGDAQGGGE